MTGQEVFRLLVLVASNPNSFQFNHYGKFTKISITSIPKIIYFQMMQYCKASSCPTNQTRLRVGSRFVLPLPGLMAKLLLSGVKVICTSFLFSHHCPLESLFYPFLLSRTGDKTSSSALASVLSLAISGDGENSEKLVIHCPQSSQEPHIFWFLLPSCQHCRVNWDWVKLPEGWALSS